MIPANGVELWTVSLDVGSARLSELAATLCPEERARAARFVFERGRREYVIARAALRDILGGHLGLPPPAIAIGVPTENGKPELRGPPEVRALRFNVSHSGGLALIAVGFGRELGVDVEEIRADRDLIGIAESIYSPAELAELRALPAGLQVEGFYLAWTRKEAFVKALGLGLSFPLEAFDVSLDPRAPAILRAVRAEGRAAGAWTLRSLAIPGGTHAAAIVAEGSLGPLLERRWPG